MEVSKEELKAIENYKMFEDAIKQTISKGDSELYIDGLEEALRDTRILLNLITKQQKKIENSVSKDKIREKQILREFELQQEYKEFKEDTEWNRYNELLEE